MTLTADRAATHTLSLLDELVLTLLNEESGYFRQVPGWNLNCAVIGGVLGELSLLSRIDTDMDSLILLDRTETGDPALDPILEEIVAEPVQRDARYWIERLAPRADSIIDLTLERLVALRILRHHEGDFWSLAPSGSPTDSYARTGRHASAERSSPTRFQTPETSSLSVLSTRATFSASYSNSMMKRRSVSKLSARWT